MALVGIAGISGGGLVLSSVALPPEQALRQTSFVCSAEVTQECGPDNAMASFSAEEDRINVRLQDVPDVLVKAVLAAEDRKFYSHGAVDPVGIGRALVADLRNSGGKQGGSTITQQYVKNVYLTRERTLTRKLKEAILSVKLERELSKDQILERYLNVVYFGRGAYGVGAAARTYFGKDVRKIELSEAAYLAGLIRSPESADASRFPAEATRRRASVLLAMQQVGAITAAEAATAGAVPWEGHIKSRTEKQGLGDVKGKEKGTEYFVEYIRKNLIARYGEKVLYGGGLRIYTTLDQKLQGYAWDAVVSTLDKPDDPSAALVAIDDLGHVKAMVGGENFAASELNLAVGKSGGGTGRQPGSSFKPFVLAEAVRQGISVRSRFNAPGKIVLPRANAGKDWKVSNYGGTEQGVLDLVTATKVSSNTVFAQLMLEVKPDNVVATAKKMGITSTLPVVNSLVLGSGEVSVLDMASAYSTFADRGEHVDPVAISRIEQVGDDGKTTVIEQAQQRRERVLSQQESDIVTQCLRGVIKGGTGTGADIGKQAAGKTGTTQENRDAWFVGYTPKLTAAVWMGFRDPGPGGVVPAMGNVHGKAVTGGSFPATIWQRFMRNATAGIDSGSFTTPKSFPGKILNSTLVTSVSATSSTSSSSTSPTATTVGPSTTTITTKPTGTTVTAPPPTSTSTSTTTTTTGPGPPIN